MRFGSSRPPRSGGLYFAPRYGETRRGRHSRKRDRDILALLPRRRRGGRYFAPRRRLPPIPRPALFVMGLLLIAIVALSWPSGGGSKKVATAGALAAVTGPAGAEQVLIDGADGASPSSSSTVSPDVVIAVAAQDASTTTSPPNLYDPPPGLIPIGKFTVLCYALKGVTASGEPVSDAAVAVDSRVIPLGTRIWIQGVGWRTALDRGSAIVGKDLDIWNGSRDWCIQFGHRYLSVWREP